MAANSTSPHGLCSPQCPLEPKHGCCTHAFPAPLLLLTLLTGLLSSSSGNPRQVPPPFLPWGDSSPCLTNNPGIYLRKAQGPWPSGGNVSADPAVWLSSPPRTLWAVLANPREAQVAEDGSAASGLWKAEQSRKEKSKRRLPKKWLLIPAIQAWSGASLSASGDRNMVRCLECQFWIKHLIFEAVVEKGTNNKSTAFYLTGSSQVWVLPCSPALTYRGTDWCLW